MVLAYHGLIEKDPIQISSISYGSKPPAHVSDYGKYVSREYQYGNTAFSTESKEYIPNIGWATGKGAWGYIWTGSVTGVADGLESYLKLHDLEVEFIASPTAEQGKTIVIDEIDNNSPLIARTYLTSSGHYAVITGYEIESNGEISYYVNDPFGKKGCYHKDYGTYTNEIAQPVKYSYSDMGLGEPSRGLFKVTSRLPTPAEPSVSTSPATSVDSSSAILNGYLSSMGGASSCTVYFEYGTTKLYGSTTGTQTKSSTGTFSQAFTGLSPGTTYHYRAVASNSAGTVCGADTMFTSSSATAPVANFIGTPASGTAPLTVQFTDTSTGDPTTWSWSFGDGATSTERHPIHTYTAPGTYTVSLTVTSAGGSNTMTKMRHVTVTSAVQISLGDVGAAKGQTTRALLTIRNASAIGAGSLDLTYDPAVVTVDAVHFASPWEGASNINNTNGKARLAYFSSSGYGQSGDVPVCTVTLRATGEPGDISPLNITVDQLIDDGGKDITSAARPLPGEFQVLYPDIPDPVRYRDAGGLYKGIQSGNTFYFGEEGLNLTCLGSVQRLVHYTNFSAGTVDAVIYVPDCRSFDPVAGGNLTPGRYYAWGSDGILGGRPWVEIREPCTGLDVLLGGTNTSVDGTSLTRNAVLDFALENNLGGLHTTPAAIAMDIEVTMPGGGRLVRFGGVDLRGIPVNASTVYARGISLNDTNPGTYTARAVWPSASDFAGKGYNSNTVSFEIAMNTTPPIVGFMANVTSGPSPLTVRFTDTSTGSPTNWFWSFGDGSFSLEQHPIHTYTAPGTYNVSLTVTNAAGSNTTTRAGYITVSRAPGQGILWDVPLSITSGTFNRTMTLGSAESATRGFDAELDLPAPPEPPGTSESAYFTCTDPTFGQLAADYKPPVDDANPEESWVLCIRSDDPVQVAWNTTLLAESVLSLTWDDGTNTIAMKTTNGTTLPAGSYSISISASTARQMDLSLQEGWNLVSTPFNNATYTVPEGAILAIYGYNPSTKGYETVSGVTALVPGKACWIASARNCTVTMTGTPVIPVTAQLKQGWNLIGSTAGRNAFDGIAIVPTESWAMAFVYGYNPQTKVYVPITELQPGEGYWGAVTRDCTITLP